MNAEDLVAVPPEVVTATLCAPAVPAGVMAVMEVLDTTTTLVAAAPPIVTVAPSIKLVPVMVIAVPPANAPATGSTLSMLGTVVLL